MASTRSSPRGVDLLLEERQDLLLAQRDALAIAKQRDQQIVPGLGPDARDLRRVEVVEGAPLGDRVPGPEHLQQLGHRVVRARGLTDGQHADLP